MQLRLQQMAQESEYHYVGMVGMGELAEVFCRYPFAEEVLEKAVFHRESMQNGMNPFTVTIRLEPEAKKQEEGDSLQVEFEACELRDGKSKTAAICQLGPEVLEGNLAKVHIFLVSKEKMDRLEANQR